MKPLALSPHIRAALERIEPQIAREPREHLYVIDSRGRVVGHRIGSKSRVSAGKKLTAWMAAHPLGFITTHNHPRSTAHSRKDVHLALLRNAVEVRVVGRDAVHRVQPLLQKDKVSKLYAYQAALDAKAKRLSQDERIEHLVRLYARGVPRARLPALVRYGQEPLPRARPNPWGACGCCDDETLHL